MSQDKKIMRTVTASQSIGFFSDFMEVMRGKGYEMVAVSSPGPELERLHDEAGFHCVSVPMERHILLKKDIKSLFQMIRVLRREKPQAVHSMTPKAGLISMLAGWITGVPVRIHTFTGLVWPTSFGIRRFILKSTDRLTCACATHIIPEGKGVMDDLYSGHITRKPMKVLGYGNVRGVDLERFDPKRFSAVRSGDNPFIFVFVGRLVGDKGVNELVSAFCRLNEEYPDTLLKLVGAFERELDPLKPQTLGLIDGNPAIIMTGARYGDDLLREYASADCFMLPSYREGFPNTVLEAGAMGLPCIVTDVNGSREIIIDGKNGLVIPPKDVNALYEAMKRMRCDSAMRGVMASCARDMIASRFEKNFVLKSLVDFYKEVLDRHNV